MRECVAIGTQCDESPSDNVPPLCSAVVHEPLTDGGEECGSFKRARSLPKGSPNCPGRYVQCKPKNSKHGSFGNVHRPGTFLPVQSGAENYLSSIILA